MNINQHSFKIAIGFTPIFLMALILAAPTATAEKADNGHVMHDYAAMEWPFHNDTIHAEKATEKAVAHTKDVKKEKKIQAKKVKAEKKLKADKKDLHAYAELTWPFS